MEEPVDKATLQKQRRMIKNRESAARSRERKQVLLTPLTLFDVSQRANLSLSRLGWDHCWEKCSLLLNRDACG